MQRYRPTPVDTGGLVVAAGALLVVVGAFLGWVPLVTGVTLDGLSLFESASPVFNGYLPVVLATLVTVLALFLPRYEFVNVVTAIAGLVVELVAVTFVVLPDVALGPMAEFATDVSVSSMGPGLYLTLVGGMTILIGGVLSYRR